MISWNPTHIVSIERVIDTSTSPLQVMTDDGNRGVFKSPKNKSGPHTLVCEYIGTMLAKWLDIPTFEMKIFHSNDIDILKNGRFSNAPGNGIGILTKWEDGVTWSVEPNALDKVSNKKDITKIVYLDTWIRNHDRFHPYNTRRSQGNCDNIFFSGNILHKNIQIKAIDHSEAFKQHNTRELSTTHLDQKAIEDDLIYGLFPEFKTRIDIKAVNEVEKKLDSISEIDVENLIREIPDDWGLELQVRESLCSFIIQRANYVLRNLRHQLFPDQFGMLF